LGDERSLRILIASDELHKVLREWLILTECDKYLFSKLSRLVCGGVCFKIAFHAVFSSAFFSRMSLSNSLATSPMLSQT
jgi:hypothetical protein